jgi:muconolactone delta-isomerase
MPVYLVDQVLPGTTVDQLMSAQRTLIDMCQRFAARGEQIRIIRSVYVPGESRWISLLEAPDPQTIEELCEVAKVPFSNIFEAVDLAIEE